ncbi:anthrone oxygenase encC [Aspergillus fischeri NRRL 181]|uniref:Anthrone oxygenase encC n=1 Tax=Neosartorya fischeri (strain ATCC 1020 / DSM 3700 / CBS 544.65 / FGSC A1164 / JCM 1740 / NRRL 181 / WB 181) TaxID=331117 RepID=A1CVE5_NEOFI|nr:conserved hypothetical protein [Aspergillus fischeri NRRL 181]EAW25722.1 conserved hypothetical protein [Aspergillus fischeri NRRL 181]
MISSQGIVKIVAITGGVWLSGKITAHSLVSVPALLQSKSEDGLSSCTILLVWRRIYECGHTHSPQIAACTSTAFAYLAWCASDRTPRLLYGTAASLVMGIVPYTLLFMGPTNCQLLKRAAAEGEEKVTGATRGNDMVNAPSEVTTEELLSHWKFLAGIRGLLPLAGGILGLFASLHSNEGAL